MTFLRFFFFLLAGTLSVSAQEPLLNVGENFARHIDQFIVSISLDGISVPNAVVQLKYDASQGPLRDVVERVLRELVSVFVPPLGRETEEFRIYIHAHAAPFASPNTDPIVASNEPTPFRLVQDATGRWRIPESEIARAVEDTSSGGWIIYDWPWVAKVVIELEYEPTGFKVTFVSGNGVDPNLQCYISENKLLYLRAWLVVPELQEQQGWTKMTLKAYDAEGRWTTVNLKNGMELARSDPPPYPVRPPRLTVSREGSGWLSVKLLGAEPGKLYTLETTPSLSPSPEGKAAAKSTVVGVGNADTNGVVSWSVPIGREVPMEFFTARTARAGETATVGLKKVP